MSAPWTQWLGWAATAVFVSSYFFTKPVWLRTAQMVGALMWIVYGAVIDAMPVVVANGLVFAAAGWTAFAQTSGRRPAWCRLPRHRHGQRRAPPQSYRPG